MKHAPERGSLVVSVGFIALGILALSGTGDMSPLGSVFPRTIAWAMIAFSAIQIGWSSLKPPREEPMSRGSTPRRLCLVGIMLAWALLLQTLGFLVTSAAASLLLLFVANYDRWTLARAVGYVITTLAVIGGVYAAFAIGLEVPLPTGIFF